MSGPAIDPATGLPLLPPGYFWRVYAAEYTSKWVQVEVIKRSLVKRWVFFSSVKEDVMASTSCRYNEYAASPVAKLRELAHYTYTTLDLSGKLAAEAAAKKARVDATLGDYPPKRLPK